MRRPSSVLPLLLTAALLTACSSTPETPEVADGDLAATAAPVEQETPGEDPAPATSEEPADDAGASEQPAEPAAPSEASTAPADPCVDREDEAFIAVVTPEDGATVSSPFTVTGCGNTFEASYVWRLELVTGDVVAEGFGTMTCGNGCVGDFDFEVTTDATGPATLVVFEDSAEDGEPTNVVEVTLLLG